MSAKKICFVGLDNYPVLNSKYGHHYFGGESVQQSLLAMAYARTDDHASMICMDYGQEDKEEIHGVTVFRSFQESAGIPGLRFFHPRITSVWDALKRADADVYYQSCASVWTGVVAHFCRVYQRKMIFRLAHDTDCIPGEQLVRFWRDRKIYEYGLQHADFIAAQSIKQQLLLRKNYGLESTVINMTVEMPDLSSEHQQDIDVLWVNNIREFKRPEKVLQLARLIPDITITMIGGAVPGNEAFYDRLEHESGELGNLNFVGPVSYHDVNDYFLRSKLFINTSDSEGFPNSFLQAFARKVPVISFFDPDNLINTLSMGVKCSDLEHMAKTLSKLLHEDHKRNVMGDNAYDFIQKNYSPDVILSKYERGLQGIINE